MGDLLIVASCNGYVRALDKNTGAVRWTYDTRPDGAPLEFHGDPLIAEDLIILGSDFRQAEGVAFVYAFEKATGKLRWKHRVPHGVMADIQRRGSNLYAVTLDDELICLDLATGDFKWKFASGFTNNKFTRNSTPAVAGNRVFFGGLNGTLYALAADAGTLLWQREFGARISTSVVVHGESVYVGTANRQLYRLNADTGTVGTELSVPATPHGPLLAAGDALLVFLGDDVVTCVDLALAVSARAASRTPTGLLRAPICGVTECWWETRRDLSLPTA